MAERKVAVSRSAANPSPATIAGAVENAETAARLLLLSRRSRNSGNDTPRSRLRSSKVEMYTTRLASAMGSPRIVCAFRMVKNMLFTPIPIASTATAVVSAIVIAVQLPSFGNAMLAGQSAAADDTLARIRTEGLQRSRALELYRTLTDDIGGRLSGSPAHLQAARWASERFAEWGLTNAHLEPFEFGHQVTDQLSDDVEGSVYRRQGNRESTEGEHQTSILSPWSRYSMDEVAYTVAGPGLQSQAEQVPGPGIRGLERLRSSAG